MSPGLGYGLLRRTLHVSIFAVTAARREPIERVAEKGDLNFRMTASAVNLLIVPRAVPVPHPIR